MYNKRVFFDTICRLNLTQIQLESIMQLVDTISNNKSSIYEMQAVSPDNIVRKGTRLGKSDRNISGTRYKNQHPIKVRFHRTTSENADSICKTGLIRQNPNYGDNTRDSDKYEPVIWTSDNPDDIPVLRRYMTVGHNSPGIETFRIDIPKDKYYKMKRKAFPHGRTGGMIDVEDGEDSLSKEAKHYSIDVFAEDIPPEYLTKMKKKTLLYEDAGPEDEIYKALCEMYTRVHDALSNMDGPDDYETFEKIIGKRILSLYPDEINTKYASLDYYDRDNHLFTILKKYYPTREDAVNLVNKIVWYLRKMNKTHILGMEFKDSKVGGIKILDINPDEHMFELLFNALGKCINTTVFCDVHAENGILVGEYVDTMENLVKVAINNDGTIAEIIN